MRRMIKKFVNRIATQFSKPFHVDYSDIPEHIRLRDNFFRELERVNTLEAVEFVKKYCKYAYPFTHKHDLLAYALRHTIFRWFNP